MGQFTFVTTHYQKIEQNTVLKKIASPKKIGVFGSNFS
jgi:hypothetical protein